MEATSGAVGSLVSTTILYPLDTCKSKYQAENRAHHHQKYRFALFVCDCVCVCVFMMNFQYIFGLSTIIDFCNFFHFKFG